MKTQKPFSPACERNREPILSLLKQIVEPGPKRLLEIGSGTGQHAVYFAPQFPDLEWVTSDVRANHSGIQAWIEEANAKNISGPLELEIGRHEIEPNTFDYVYTANVLHIISIELVRTLIKMFQRSLASGSQVIIYGPFNYGGQFTSESNREFDQYLRATFAGGCIKDFEEICQLMSEAGMQLMNDYEMPANNRILLFKTKTV